MSQRLGRQRYGKDERGASAAMPADGAPLDPPSAQAGPAAVDGHGPRRRLNDLPIVWRCLILPLLGAVALGTISAVSLTAGAKNDAAIIERELESDRAALVGQTHAIVERIRTTMHRTAGWKASLASDADLDAFVITIRLDSSVLAGLVPRLIASWPWGADGTREAAVRRFSAFAGAVEQAADLVTEDPYVANFFINGLEAEYSELDMLLRAMRRDVAAREQQKSIEMAATLSGSLFSTQATIAAVVLVFVVFGIVLARSIANPIHAIVDALGELRRGNLDVRVAHAQRRDEIGRMAQAVAEFRDNLRLTRALEQQRDEFTRELERLAYRDSLTGLGNRALFQRHLQRVFNRTAAGTAGRPALMMIDLDRFKEVNDTLGHEAGDSLLYEVACRLHLAVRPGDGLYRLGGDEFAVIFDHMDSLTSAAPIAERILAGLREPLRLASGIATVGASIGIAGATGQEDEASEVARHADLALYQVKAGGRNGYRFFEESMNVIAQRRRLIERELRLAMSQGTLMVHYQPQLSLDGARVVGLEALVRWHHPEIGAIAPSEFIPLAEQTGLILDLGAWVLHSAFAQIAHWRGQGLEPPPVAVNVSGHQLHSRAFVTLAVGLIAAQGGRRPRVTLELTESVFAASDGDALVSVFEELHRAGYDLSLDDFGTGYSSLSYLRRLPLHELKIDASFVRGIEQSSSASSLVRSIVSLGHGLGLRIVAEGVELEAERAALAAVGCDHAQGYLFAKPMPADRIAILLREWRLASARQPRLVEAREA